MSRTFRCKNYERENNSSWDTFGRKVAGFFTRRDYVTTVGGGYARVARPPTIEEFGREYWRMHGDSHVNDRSPGHYYRNFRERKHRQYNRREIQRYLANELYEPMCEANPKTCDWDWR